MVGLIELLNFARNAGLTWHRDGERLVVRGPKSLADIAKQLVARKDEVFATITRLPPTVASDITYDPIPDWAINQALKAFAVTSSAPTVPMCFCCQGRRWWRSFCGSHLICGFCHRPHFDDIVAEWIEPSKATVSSSETDHAPIATTAETVSADWQTQHRGGASLWAGEDSELIDWFRSHRDRLPSEPFQLFPWAFVGEPAKFYKALEGDIREGSDGPRAVGLRNELRRLREMFQLIV